MDMGIWLLIAAMQAAHAEPEQAPPIDQCGDDRTFVEYRARLLRVIARKEVSGLRALVASNITYSFGDEGGWPGFANKWALDRPADSELWHELAEVLNLGCEKSDRQRIAPGNFNKLSDYGLGLPPFVAVQKAAAFRSSPDDTAPLVMALDHHVLVEILDDEADVVPEGWLHARLTDGRSGYVRLSAVRSALDYRAGFEKRDGRWVMTSFIAGD